jgi:hypothetical protein
MSLVGRASAWHLRRRAPVPLAIAAAIGLAACGGGGHAKASASVKASPARLVSQTFSASGDVASGNVSLTLDLALDGIKQLDGKPVSLTVSGPFSRSGHQISTDLTAVVSAAGSSATIGFDRVDGKSYLGLGGTFYDLTQGAVSSIGIKDAVTSPGSAPAGGSGASGAFGALGIDLRSWITDPVELPQTDVGGVTTDHLRAQIDVANVLGDVSKMIGAAGATGASGSSASSNVTSLLPLLESAITTAQVDIYTGVADHIVRRADLDIAFTVPQIAAGAIDGLTGGSLTADATLTDVNQPQTITAPAGAQPATKSRLLNGVFALESKFGSLASLVAGLGLGSGSNFGGSVSSSSSSTASSSG